MNLNTEKYKKIIIFDTFKLPFSLYRVEARKSSYIYINSIRKTTIVTNNLVWYILSEYCGRLRNIKNKIGGEFA